MEMKKLIALRGLAQSIRHGPVTEGAAWIQSDSPPPAALRRWEIETSENCGDANM
jgi:hypothetical protein